MNQRFLVTTSIVMAMLVASIDTTILHTTMPVIAEELGGFQFYAWTFTAYVLASTSLMPLAGKLADLYGRKRIFMMGVLIFMIGSLLCGLAQSMIQLIVFRAIQGLGAGIMMPLVQIIAGDLYTVEKRGKIQALFTSMWMLSAVLAPLAGAMFIEWADWRWIFLINVPVCLLTLALIAPYKDVYAGKQTAVDWLGALLFAGGTSALLLITSIDQGRFICLTAGIALLVLFIRHERKHPAPMLPRHLFRNRLLNGMMLNNLLICLALFGVPNYIPLYLQENGSGVLQSGLVLIAMSAGWMAMSVRSGKWLLRAGYSRLVMSGNILAVAAAILFLFAGATVSYTLICLALIVLGAALGLIFTVSIIGAQQLVGDEEKGISTSLLLFIRNTGLACGVSLMGLLMNRAATVNGGMQDLFGFSLIGALLALLPALWLLRAGGTAIHKEQETASPSAAAPAHSVGARRR